MYSNNVREGEGGETVGSRDFDEDRTALKHAGYRTRVYAHRRFQHGPQYYHKAATAVMHKHNFSGGRCARLTCAVAVAASLISHAVKHCINSQ